MNCVRASVLLCVCVLSAAGTRAVAQDTTRVSQIVLRMAANDSLELAFASLAWRKAADPRVRAYAGILTTDHATHLTRTMALVDSATGTRAATLDDAALSRTRAMLVALDSLPVGPAWDAAFLRVQVAHHRAESDLVSANIRSAPSTALVEHMKASLLMLTKHRDIARSIATALGVTLP
jgi:predicted outer membrane protein